MTYLIVIVFLCILGVLGLFQQFMSFDCWSKSYKSHPKLGPPVVHSCFSAAHPWQPLLVRALGRWHQRRTVFRCEAAAVDSNDEVIFQETPRVSGDVRKTLAVLCRSVLLYKITNKAKHCLFSVESLTLKAVSPSLPPLLPPSFLPSLHFSSPSLPPSISPSLPPSSLSLPLPLSPSLPQI